MLEQIAARAAADTAGIEPQRVRFAGAGTNAAGQAEVTISRASIAIRFRPDGAFTAPKAAYGESAGRITGAHESWSAEVNDAGRTANGDQLFTSRALRFAPGAAGAAVAATRVVLAGDAWAGAATIFGRPAILTPLSLEAPTHHERRLAVTVEGDLDDVQIETIGRAGAFVGGLDLEVLRVERYDAGGLLLDVEHRRGFRRVGRGPHSPFTGVPAADKTRAWAALVNAFPRLTGEGVPIDLIVDQISAHNQVSQIHVSAVLLLLATQTAAYQRLHGDAVEIASDRAAEMRKLSAELGLGLSEADVARFERLRVELLDAGFFHAPGYETGRPQVDIKFLRDLAHTTVLRLCGYTGPFYGAERFVVRELAAATT